MGTASTPLDGVRRAALCACLMRGFSVPFTVRNGMLQLYADPQARCVVSDQRERVVSLTLPEIPEITWQPPEGAPVLCRGQRCRDRRLISGNGWPCWAIGASAEWLFFQDNSARSRSADELPSKPPDEHEEKELVIKDDRPPFRFCLLFLPAVWVAYEWPRTTSRPAFS